ncbi:MAG TPA: hypothetical protein VFA90_12360 [Terriglobales bacterium]|nr:hypothetical protein [Terriglobales bacterium]
MKQMFVRATGSLLIVVLSATMEPLLGQQASTPASNQPTQSTQPPIELPENPGSTPAQTSAPAAPPQQNSEKPKQPSGTAVAPAVQVSGGAASKPAGVAIAPPKQRQVHSWLIRFGFIVGAGAALGTVAALSAASPGHVPGSGR